MTSNTIFAMRLSSSEDLQSADTAMDLNDFLPTLPRYWRVNPPFAFLQKTVSPVAQVLPGAQAHHV